MPARAITLLRANSGLAKAFPFRPGKTYSTFPASALVASTFSAMSLSGITRALPLLARAAGKRQIRSSTESSDHFSWRYSSRRAAVASPNNRASAMTRDFSSASAARKRFNSSPDNVRMRTFCSACILIPRQGFRSQRSSNIPTFTMRLSKPRTRLGVIEGHGCDCGQSKPRSAKDIGVVVPATMK